MALRYNMDKQLIETGKQTRFKKERKLTQDQISSISKGHKKDIRMITGDAKWNTEKKSLKKWWE